MKMLLQTLVLIMSHLHLITTPEYPAVFRWNQKICFQGGCNSKLLLGHKLYLLALPLYLLRFLLIFHQKLVVVVWSRNRIFFFLMAQLSFPGFLFFSSTDQCKVSLVSSRYLALPFISAFIFQKKTIKSLCWIPFSSIQLSTMTNN